MLKEEILKMLETFEEFAIPEEKQRNLIIYGIRFDFTYGDPDPSNRNKYLDAFEFAEFLRICKSANLDVDIADLLAHPSDTKYEELLKAVDTVKSFQKKLVK